MEGESFLIRCHGWKNRDVRKVTYYRNGKALKYWYENHNIFFNNATVRDSGTYYCTGLIWKINHTSNFLNIAVTKGELVKKEGRPPQGRGERGHRSLKWLQRAEWDSWDTLSSPQACREEHGVGGMAHLSVSVGVLICLLVIVIPAHMVEFV